MINISKKQFEDVKTLSKEWQIKKTLFDTKVEEIYDGHYSDFDYSYIIDSLDYGVGELSYECFCELMQNIKSGNGNDNKKYCDIVKKHNK